MIEICCDHSRNVKRWDCGSMALRWCAAGLLEAKKQFRRVNGHLISRHYALRTALNEHVGVDVTPLPTLQKRRWPHSSAARGRHPKFHASRDILGWIAPSQSAILQRQVAFRLLDQSIRSIRIRGGVI